MHFHQHHHASNSSVAGASVRRPVPVKRNANVAISDWVLPYSSGVTNSSTTMRSDHRQNASFDARETEAVRTQFAALKELEDGWDGLGSVKPDSDVLAVAAAYLEFALRGQSSVPTPTIVPVADGGIQAEWYSVHARFEIYFESDGDIAAWRENRSTGVEMEAEGTDAVQLLVDWAANFDDFCPELD